MLAKGATWRLKRSMANAMTRRHGAQTCRIRPAGQAGRRCCGNPARRQTVRHAVLPWVLALICTTTSKALPDSQSRRSNSKHDAPAGPDRRLDLLLNSIMLPAEHPLAQDADQAKRMAALPLKSEPLRRQERSTASYCA